MALQDGIIILNINEKIHVAKKRVSYHQEEVSNRSLNYGDMDAKTMCQGHGWALHHTAPQYYQKKLRYHTFINWSNYLDDPCDDLKWWDDSASTQIGRTEKGHIKCSHILAYIFHDSVFAVYFLHWNDLSMHLRMQSVQTYIPLPIFMIYNLMSISTRFLYRTI